MYKHTIVIEVHDDAVHKHSIKEWEDRFLHDRLIDPEDLPLSYAAIAELLAYQVYAFDNLDYSDLQDGGRDFRVTETTEYINEGTGSIRTISNTTERTVGDDSQKEDRTP